MKEIKQREYKMLQDFQRVEQFLSENYNKEDHNGYLLPEFWEYAHTHPMFKPFKAHRMGIWEENGAIVGVCAYEMDVGDTFIFAKRGYDFLYEEMLRYGEKELVGMNDGKMISDVWTTDQQESLVRLLEKDGYELKHEEDITIYPYHKGFDQVKLPKGYRIATLDEENDFKKINECMWKGFDHEGEPGNDLDQRRLMQSGPNFRKDLSMVVVAPDGSYATFAGIWLNEKNRYAYLEPLCTVPKHRKLGLGKAVLMEAMKRTEMLGVDYCYGGLFDYYKNMGFDHAGVRRMYRKIL